MNGDLSLSQSLGGLRIANPDDDVNPSSSPLPASASHSSSLPPAPLPWTKPAHPYPLTTAAQDERYPSPPSSATSRGLNVEALACDPSTHSGTPHSLPSTSPYLRPPGEQPGDSYRYSYDPSVPSGREAQEIPQAIPRTTNRHSTSSRPTSGLYSHSNISSNSNQLPESRYQRLRAESTQSPQSSQSTVRRSNSRATATAMQAGASTRPPNGLLYRQYSETNAFPSTSPPAQSSRPQYGGDDYNYNPISPSRTRTGSNNAEGGQGSNSEGWQEKGPVAGFPRGAGQTGRASSRSAKKGVRDFNFGRTLGEGSYSTVLAATDRLTSREYAIKVLDKRHIIKEKKVKYVNIEKDTLSLLTDHPGIVRLYYTFQDERSLYFVLDLASGGELLGVLKKMTSFDEECSRFYGAQILDAIEYMHQRGIIHRDLKPENVLLDDQMHVKITDFGTAKILDLSGKAQFGKISVTKDPLDGSDTDRAVSFVGTAEYVSPELLTDKTACKASDLWAFGCIIYQLLAGRPPFKAVNEYQTFQKIVKLDYSFPEGFPTVARDLITKLLVLDPTERPHIEAIKRHPFFDGIQWGKGLWKQRAPHLRAYNPLTRDAVTDRRESAASTSKAPIAKPPPSTSASQSMQPRPQPRIITELAPPTQLDIDWSPVLTKANERILKLGQFVVNTTPAPHSPTSRGGTEPAVEAPSKFSRFFGASNMKKRQRLVLITSGGRLILAPSGGDRKEAKQSIELTDPDVSWRSQQDSKGYTIWSVHTRDKHFTFEDPKANTGDSGSSIRSTKEWLEYIEDIRQYAMSQRIANSYSADSINGLSPSMRTPSNTANIDNCVPPETKSPPPLRKTLRKEPKDAPIDDESMKGRKRFSKRHSKNGLAAVF